MSPIRPSVYVETTIVSYLASRRSRNLITSAHQQITQAWWKRRRRHFELFTSEFVVAEASQGDPVMAHRRLGFLSRIPGLERTDETIALANRLLEAGPLPLKAAADALHIAVATCHGMDYLLTWNCAHIANAEIRTKIEAVCRLQGFESPILTTPEELMGRP